MKKRFAGILLFAVSVLVAPVFPPARQQGEKPKPAPNATEALEQIAKVGIETVLSFLLDTQTTVSSVRLVPENQRLEIQGLAVANPKGFSAENAAFSAERVLVEADPLVLFSPTATVRLIEVEGAAVHAESQLGKGFNLKKLLDNVNRFPGPRPKDEKRWVLEKGLLKGCIFRFSSDIPSRKLEYPLDTLEFSMKGPHGEGVTADKIVAEVLTRLIDEFQKGNRDTLGDALRQILGG